MKLKDLYCWSCLTNRTAIFKLLAHYRRKYLSDRHSAKPDPYTTANSFAYLRKHCIGNNERMSVLYRYSFINHERKNTQKRSRLVQVTLGSNQSSREICISSDRRGRTSSVQENLLLRPVCRTTHRQWA